MAQNEILDNPIIATHTHTHTLATQETHAQEQIPLLPPTLRQIETILYSSSLTFIVTLEHDFSRIFKYTRVAQKLYNLICNCQ